MSWDRKQSGAEKRYYYRTIRTGEKTTKVYVGKGPLAEMAARLDEMARARQRAAKEAWQVEQLQIADADAALDEFRAAVDLLSRAMLLVAGFHQHHRQWRRRIHGRSDEHPAS
jgi:hypothetical protein